MTLLSCCSLILTVFDGWNHLFDLVLEGNDFVQNICIDLDDQQRIIVWKVRERCQLLCVVDTAVPYEDYSDHVEEALELIEQSKLLAFPH